MRIFGLSDIGKVRRENQDCFAIRALSGGILAAVCDGMGGAAAGQIASELACGSFMDHASAALEVSGGEKAAESLGSGADKANRDVYARSMRDAECEGMGTTLVALYANNDGVTLLNIGDSGAYRVSGGTMTKLTHDHSLVQEMMDLGLITNEQARRHPRKNIITRVVGGESTVRSDIFEAEAKDGDVFLLCSDGLTNALSDEQIVSCCEGQTDPEAICAALIDAALCAGARDNVTAVVLIFEKEAADNE